jgi:hypothetical protein
MRHEEHDEWEMGHQALNYLKDVLRDCQAAGRFQGMDVEYLSFMIWSAMHGMCALYCRERCNAYHDVNLGPEELMSNGYKYFSEMLGKI